MRIVSWNVNGLRACCKRRGLTIKQLLESLEADVICIQETKLREPERDLAIVDGWDSFFACHGSAAQAGVATYVRTAAALPFAAEEGFSGLAAGRGGGGGGGGRSLASVHEALAAHFSEEELLVLDGEGRVVITDHGPLALINVYGPAITNEDTAEERLAFKVRFYQAIELRAAAFRAAVKAVVVLGDLNIGPAQIDYAGGHAPDMERPDRAWLHRRMLAPPEAGGLGFVDLFRRRWPGRAGAFTCWSLQTMARVTNNGSRLDLVLTAGLPLDQAVAAEAAAAASQGAAADQGLPAHRAEAAAGGGGGGAAAGGGGGAAAGGGGIIWAGACDIWPAVEGSDHCPVWFELCSGSGGSSSPLPCAAAAPPCAMRHRFRGRQASLRAFLQTAPADSSGAAGAAAGAEGDSAASVNQQQQQQEQQQQQQPWPPPLPLAAAAPAGPGSQQAQGGAPRLVAQAPGAQGAGKRCGAGRLQQASLKSMLFGKRAAGQVEEQQGSQADGSQQRLQQMQQQQQTHSQGPTQQQQQQQAAGPPPPDEAFLAAEAAAAEAQRQQSQAAAKDFFRALQQRTADPLCECRPPRRAAKKQSNKQGPNKSRWFWTCELPAGARCGFFRWVEPKATDHPWTSGKAKRPRMGGGGGGGGLAATAAQLQQQ